MMKGKGGASDKSRNYNWARATNRAAALMARASHNKPLQPTGRAGG